MSNPDWKEAPEGATHWDALGGCFCNEQGWWIDESILLQITYTGEIVTTYPAL